MRLPVSRAGQPPPVSRCEQVAREAEDTIADAVACVRRLRVIKPSYERLFHVGAAIGGLREAVSALSHALNDIDPKTSD